MILFDTRMIPWKFCVDIFIISVSRMKVSFMEVHRGYWQFLTRYFDDRVIIFDVLNNFVWPQGKICPLEVSSWFSAPWKNMAPWSWLMIFWLAWCTKLLSNLSTQYQWIASKVWPIDSLYAIVTYLCITVPARPDRLTGASGLWSTKNASLFVSLAPAGLNSRRH